LFPLACASSFDPSSCPDFSFAPVRSHIKASQSFLFFFIFQARSRFLPLVLLGLLPTDLVLLCGSAVNASGFVQQVCTQGSFFFRVSVLGIFGTGPATEFSSRSLPPPSLLLVLLATTAPVRLAPLSFCCSKYCCGLCVTSCLCYFLQLAGFFRAFALNRALVFDFYAAGSSFDCCC
jgi:hypothetical protein